MKRCKEIIFLCCCKYGDSIKVTKRLNSHADRISIVKEFSVLHSAKNTFMNKLKKYAKLMPKNTIYKLIGLNNYIH